MEVKGSGVLGLDVSSFVSESFPQAAEEGDSSGIVALYCLRQIFFERLIPLTYFATSLPSPSRQKWTLSFSSVNTLVEIVTE